MILISQSDVTLFFLHQQRAGTELKRARAAIVHVQESEESRSLETRVLTQLLLCVNGFTFETPEGAQVKERMAVLSRLTLSKEAASNELDSNTPDAAKYEAFISGSLARMIDALQPQAILTRYQPLTPEGLSQSYAGLVEAGEMME